MGIHEPDFENKVNTKKINISEAIEYVDEGKKSPLPKKGKKKRGSQKSKDQDLNMLSLKQPDANESWDSNRDHANEYNLQN